MATGELQVRALYDYLTDGNRALFEAEIVGPELYRYRVPNRSTSSKGTSAALNQLAGGQDVSKTEEGSGFGPTTSPSTTCATRTGTTSER